MLTIVLDRASLEVVKTKKGSYTLLNSDDHHNLLKRHDRDPSECRPDILHQELMAVTDSPLNKANPNPNGLRIFIRSDVMIQLFDVRVPRTYKRFAGLMCQLIHKRKIRSTDGKLLMKIIKNELPEGRRFAFSKNGKHYTPAAFAAMLPDDCVLIFGAMAKGSIDIEDAESICISEYPLSGAAAIHRVLAAIEAHRGIY